MTRRLILLAFVALSLGAPVHAAAAAACPQAADSAIGRRVRVTLGSGEAVSGKMLRATEDSVVLRAKGKEVELESDRIDRIEIRSGSKAVRNVLLSAGAGALAGVIFGAAKDEADSDSLAIIFALIGAGGGAGVGAALPARTVVCD